MQTRSQFSELGSGAFFLSDLFVPESLLVVRVQQSAHLFVLVLHVLQVLLACVKVVLVLAAVVPAITDTISGSLTIFR